MTPSETLSHRIATLKKEIIGLEMLEQRFPSAERRIEIAWKKGKMWGLREARSVIDTAVAEEATLSLKLE